MTYNRALLLFRLQGPGKVAAEALREALRWNPQVAPYLLGQERVPGAVQPGIELGGESEAAEYASSYLHRWRVTPNAQDWLRAQLAEGGS
jgi:hypothetical protein